MKIVGGILQQNKDNTIFGFVRLEGHADIVGVRGTKGDGTITVASQDGWISVELKRHNSTHPNGPIARGLATVRSRRKTHQTKIVGFSTRLESGVTAIGLAEDRPAQAVSFRW